MKYQIIIYLPYVDIGVIKRQQASFEYGGVVMLLYTWQIKENVSLLPAAQSPLLPTVAWNDEGMGRALCYSRW